MKIAFKNDYSEGCHPAIIEAILSTNTEQETGYGDDAHTKKAKRLIAERLGSSTAKIHFVSGGTQANLLVIHSLLRPYESVIAAKTAHICDHEAGAIEAVGHKIHVLETADGKIKPEQVQEIATKFTNFPHQVKPRLVFISNATELGTHYTKLELKALYNVCKKLNLFLYVDGARLGQALSATTNDINWTDLAQYTDVFYIGGTKNGALLGEAIVINNPGLQVGFEYHLKQKGALLAKGRVLGIQFEQLFQNELFEALATHANNQAMKIKMAFEQKGISFLTDSFTNQLFPILSKEQIDKLSKKFEFYVWQPVTEHTFAVRIITSWATTDKNVNAFVKAISGLEQYIK